MPHHTKKLDGLTHRCASSRIQGLKLRCHANSLSSAFLRFCASFFIVSISVAAAADLALLKEHCGKCHSGDRPKGDFRLRDLGDEPDLESLDYWINSFDRVSAGEMPPAKHNRMTEEETKGLADFLRRTVTSYEEQRRRPTHTPPRRLNNREFENSLCDVLLLDQIGTHDPLAMLLGDTLHDGFGTHGETLGMSEYHLDQYVTAVRHVLDNVIFAGPMPESRRYELTSDELFAADRSQRRRADQSVRSVHGLELRDPRHRAFCEKFAEAPSSGTYRISFRAKGLDRHVYSQDQTGIYDGDPLILRMHLGNRSLDFETEDGESKDFQVSAWLAKGTPVEFSHHTDGLRLIGNGNFKFQNRIAHDFIKEHDPDLYNRVVRDEVPKARSRRGLPSHWVHWVRYWQGPRPAIESVAIEGPIYKSWPPKRQVALLGEAPSADEAFKILRPIAQRAWRRPVSKDELAPIVGLVQSQASKLGDVEAIKEGIVAILVSPSFLMINPQESSAESRFATKLAYFLGSTTPDSDLLDRVRDGQLSDFESLRKELAGRLGDGKASEFLTTFPYSWLQLDRINFMSPDVDRYPLYEKKSISVDMVDEVLTFFRHAVETNRPVPELLTADYSFVNADLAKVYGLTNVADDSVLRKYTFHDGKRGGFLGMGAFLTLTADTLSTSPIHRAVFVMENFMGFIPHRRQPMWRSKNRMFAPPGRFVRCCRLIKPMRPAQRVIRTSIRLATHLRTTIPSAPGETTTSAFRYRRSRTTRQQRTRKGKKRASTTEIPIDASATFLSGDHYQDIVQFRELMKNDASRNRFVRCFITKLLTYANGVEPNNFSEIDKIAKVSALHDYRIIETMAAVIDSPLFRETNQVIQSDSVQHLFGAKLLLRKFELANASKEQIGSFDRLSAQLTEKVTALRKKAGITKETIKRRDLAYSSLKKMDLQGDALWMELQSKMGITDQQRDAFRQTKQLNQEFRSSAMKILTEGQRNSIASKHRGK